MSTAFDPTQYQWKPLPEVAEFVSGQIEQALRSSPWLKQFRKRLLNETGTRLVDWLDHIAVDSEEGLAALGFVEDAAANVWEHPGGIFPAITVAHSMAGSVPELAIKVDSVECFLETHDAELATSGKQVSGDDEMKMARVSFSDEGAGFLRVVERHGYRGLRKQQPPEQHPVKETLESFRNRPRPYENPNSGFVAAKEIFSQAANAVGRDLACDLFFQAEREFWQSRNEAARVQYTRQQALGLGWANHDHHTYRCSREGFAPLVEFLELTGFDCRERFYAGRDAGWGAQVLEHPVCEIVIFADVDMTEEELHGDFAHEGLVPTDDLGTVGLWCKLHGDSFLTAGMHHLECQFDFDASREQLAKAGIETMAPFTDFPYLKQAFTKGERWEVSAERLSALVDAGAITSEEAERMQKEKVIGSHLEILERNDGFKGFNQTGISHIITKTNPKNAI